MFVGLNSLINIRMRQPYPNPTTLLRSNQLLKRPVIFYMKKGKTIFFSFLLITIITGNSSCGAIHNLFGPKYGCPSDGRNVGAERILSGEKLPNPPKFKGGN
jgi:hypothetical protein